jgi:hypothetical protein
MSDKTSLFARLVASASAAVAPPAAAGAAAPAAGGEPDPAPAAPEIDEARIETGLLAAKAEGVAEGTKAGAAAERARTAAVFASPEGQANLPMAAWMLEQNPASPADDIVAKLKTMPAMAAAAPPGKPAAAATPLADAPKVDLNGGKPAANATDGNDNAADFDGVWGKAIGAQRERYFGAAANMTDQGIANGGTGAGMLYKTGN